MPLSVLADCEGVWVDDWECCWKQMGWYFYAGERLSPIERENFLQRMEAEIQAQAAILE